jgi:hypothetical protein
MPHLIGHQETLAWTDFQGPVPANPTASAFTSTSYNVTTSSTWVILPRPHDYRFTDLTVQVSIDRAKMWSVVADQSDDLLTHEQGHYEITALIARDLFNALLPMVTPPNQPKFPSAQALRDALTAAQQPFNALLAQLQSNNGDGLYDSTTKHGTDADMQRMWNRTFAEARSSGRPLSDVLTQMGACAGLNLVTLGMSALVPGLNQAVCGPWM